jgi:hypothetical protein
MINYNIEYTNTLPRPVNQRKNSSKIGSTCHIHCLSLSPLYLLYHLFDIEIKYTPFIFFSLLNIYEEMVSRHFEYLYFLDQTSPPKRPEIRNEVHHIILAEKYQSQTLNLKTRS